MEFWLLLTIIATVVITPLIHCPLKSLDGYILPQIGAGAIGISLAMILLTLISGLPTNGIAILSILYFIYLMMSNAWSTVNHSSLRDAPLIFLSVFGLVATAVLFDVRENITLVSLGVFFISNLLALYAIGQRFCFDPFFPERLQSKKDLYEGKDLVHVPRPFQNKKFQDSRAISTIGNTNFAVGYFLTAIPFLVWLCFEVSPWFILSFLPIVGAIVAAECRAGYLSLAIGGLCFVLFISSRGLLIDGIIIISKMNNGLAILFLFLVLSLIGVYCFALWLHKKGIFKSLSNENSTLNIFLDFEGKADNSLEDRNSQISHLRYRLRYWRAAWQLIKKRPLTGYGLRTYRKEVYQAQGDLNLKDNGKFLGPAYQTPQPRECHNDFIENFVEGGFPAGLLFLVILGSVFYQAYVYGQSASTYDFIMVSAIAAAIIAVLVDVFFFFPLRLGSSALLFWMSLAIIPGIAGNINLVQIPFNPLATVFIIGGLAAMLWEGVIKPNLGNYYFSCYSFSTKTGKKERFLIKAIELCPRETVFRTHMMIGYLNTFTDEAIQNAEVMRQHFDGMTPGWANEYNSAVVSAKDKRYEEAMRHLQKCLFYLPSFQDARTLFQQLWPRAPFGRRRIVLKQISQEAINLIIAHQAQIRAAQAEMKNLQNEMFKQELSTQNVVLAEKCKLGIPVDWPFDGEHNLFIPPDKIPPGKKILEVGPAKLPILVPEGLNIQPHQQ